MGKDEGKNYLEMFPSFKILDVMPADLTDIRKVLVSKLQPKKVIKLKNGLLICPNKDCERIDIMFNSNSAWEREKRLHDGWQNKKLNYFKDDDRYFCSQCGQEIIL